jgi:DNA invertase Pin-like site-specific DNA recombinase
VTEYVDKAISGTKDRRPALDKLVADCRRGKIDIIVCWKFDRFARSVSHLLRTLEELKELGIEFVSFTEAIDTRSAMGKMVFTVLGAVAELERSLIIERVRAGQAAAKRAGKHIGRISEVTAEQRACVSALCATGNSVRQIATKIGLPKSTVGRLVAELRTACGT